MGMLDAMETSLYHFDTRHGEYNVHLASLSKKTHNKQGIYRVITSNCFWRGGDEPS